MMSPGHTSVQALGAGPSREAAQISLSTKRCPFFQICFFQLAHVAPPAMSMLQRLHTHTHTENSNIILLSQASNHRALWDTSKVYATAATCSSKCTLADRPRAGHHEEI